ncbi:MAG: hypothetical protein R2807_10750 [Chitinophagales bacterium]
MQEILNKIDKPENQNILQERVLKSIHYFGENLAQQIIQPLHTYIIEKSK